MTGHDDRATHGEGAAAAYPDPAWSRAQPSRRRTLVAAAANALIPGLGHLLLGRRRLAALWFAPHVPLIAIAAWFAAGGIGRLGSLLEPDRLLLLAALAFAIALWRVAAAIGPVVGRRAPLTLGTVLVVGLLLGAAPALWAGETALDVRATLLAIFEPIPSPSGSPIPAPTPTLRPGMTPGPTLPPTPEPSQADLPGFQDGGTWAGWRDDGVLELLLVGGDAGPGRWSRRTDTMMLLRLDPATGRAALIGLPRNLSDFPLPPESAGATPDGRFHDFLNAVYVFAEGHPKFFPGPDGQRGFLALRRTVETITDTHVDGMVVLDLQGFVGIVDALGGVTITLEESVTDTALPNPDGSGSGYFHLDAGTQHLDGTTLLGYVRSRHQDSDYGRMRRQQGALLAIRRALDPLTVLPRIGQLLAAARGAFWADMPPSAVPTLIQLASAVDADHVARVLLEPPAVPEYLGDRGVAIVQKLVADSLEPPPPPPIDPNGGRLRPA